jgi:hypothetical protein
VFGYGLKHEDAFQNTHLGKLDRLNAMTRGKPGDQAEIVDKE